MKTCSGCGETLPFAAFNRHKSRPDGFQAHCKACRKADYAANRDAVRERVRAHYAANRQARAEYQRAYYAENQEAIAARQRVYQQNNPHLRWQANYRQRVRRFGFEPVVEHFTRADLIARWGDACWHCDSGEFEELDHYVPVAAGGTHTLSNCRPSCAACNRAKQNQSDRELIAAAKTA